MPSADLAEKLSALTLRRSSFGSRPNIWQQNSKLKISLSGLEIQFNTSSRRAPPRSPRSSSALISIAPAKHLKPRSSLWELDLGIAANIAPLHQVLNSVRRNFHQAGAINLRAIRSPRQTHSKQRGSPPRKTSADCSTARGAASRPGETDRHGRGSNRGNRRITLHALTGWAAGALYFRPLLSG